MTEGLQFALLGRRTRDRRSLNLIIERFGLISSPVTARAGDVSPVAAEQNAHVHFVGLALKPAKESTNSIPPIIFVIFICIIDRSFLAFDDEVLVGLRQFFEGDIDIDLFSFTGSK